MGDKSVVLIKYLAKKEVGVLKGVGCLGGRVGGLGVEVQRKIGFKRGD